MISAIRATNWELGTLATTLAMALLVANRSEVKDSHQLMCKPFEESSYSLLYPGLVNT